MSGKSGHDATANQTVAWNMAYFRKAAGLSQAELGERLGGWSAASVSAAERSWDGRRVKKFDADEIARIAEAVRVPVSAMFLPVDSCGRPGDALIEFLENQMKAAQGISVQAPCVTCADRVPRGFTCNTCGRSGQ